MDSAAEGPPRRQLLVVGVVAWVWSALLFAVWGLATPLWGSADSYAQVFRAYSVWHGQVVAPDQPGATGGEAVIRVPAGLASSAASVSCFAFHPEQPASCIVPPGDEPGTVEMPNGAGKYPPAYYLLVGWPSLFLSGTALFYGVTLAAAALAAVFVAWAVVAAHLARRRVWPLAGVLVAITPQVMYFGGAANPNSVEITGAIGLASCSVAFLRNPDGRAERVVFRLAMLAASAMILARMLAPVWVAAWIAVVWLLWGRELWRVVLRRPHVWWLLAPAVATVSLLAWTYATGLTSYGAPVADLSLRGALHASFDRIVPETLYEQVGQFGWLDTPLAAPWRWTYVAAWLLLVGLALLALRLRARMAVVAAAGAALVLPILIQAQEWNSLGPVWQGRYTLPLTVMVSILALALVADDAWRQRAPRALAWAAPVCLAAVVLVDVQALVLQLRRIVGGLPDGDPFEGPYSPPLPPQLLLGVLVLLLLAALLSLVYPVVEARRGAGRGGDRDLPVAPIP